MSRKKIIYKITLTNWDKHNLHSKRSHKKTMIANNFFEDAKISLLSKGGKLLMLGLILRCGDVGSRSCQCSYDVVLRLCGGRGDDVSKLLDQLQSLQLLSYEVLNKMNINEMKRNELMLEAEKSEKKELPKIIEKTSYSSELKISSKPTRINSISELVQILGEEFLKDLAQTFPDPKYLDVELNKLVMYFKNNPKKNLKSPRGWRRTVQSWMARSWDNHVNRQPTRKQSSFTGMADV